MAAYAAVLSLKFIINQIQQHSRPPISLHQQQLDSLTANLSFLQNFLEVYSKEEDELESRISDAAYTAEDVIESHIVDQIHTGSTCHGDNISCVDLYQGLEKVIQDMDLITKEVREIVKEKKMGDQHSSNSLVSVGSVRHISRMQSNAMVDFGDILNDVMYKLTRQGYNLEIVPIVGMGGMGKTTLARNIYAHSLIVQHFDILAWVTISQEYSVPDILIQVLSDENNRGEMCADHKLGERVHKKLYGRRYLIVMDDIWSIEAWDKVKTFFPNSNNGSKIIITTRLSHLAFQLSGSHDFQMNFFDEDKSWSLFCKIVFGNEVGCPIELENIGKKIVKNCRGLPLSIAVMGGLLTKSNMTHDYWEYTLKNLSSQINLENNENCLQILRKSYKELSIHLKPCFLYMGIFPEDYEIHVSDLIKLWVAEGILKPIESKSFEDVAEEYVDELIERNLIIVHELHWNRKTKSCKIHDLLRDLCLREAKKQRFICILRPRDLNNIPQDINMERRICIHDKRGKIYPRFIHAIESASFIRSLIVIGNGSYRPPPSSTCRLLRVLSCADNEHTNWKGNADAEAVFQQANLRYLSPGTLKEEHGIRTSWYLLWNLQTLDVVFYDETSRVTIAPSEFWKMSHLRHVKFYQLQLPNPLSGEDESVLENLQTLSGILNFTCSEEVVKRIPNIKKLKLFYDGDRVKEEGLHSFCLNNLCRLRNLKSLHLEFDYDEYSDPVTMENLSLPHSLKKLCLRNTRFLWEDLNTKIGSLPLLEALNLHNYCPGPEWETIEEQFCSLKFLRIEECDLKYWISDDTHFPRLEHLVLEYLYELEEIPLSIGDIPTLQSIKVEHCSKSAMASAQRIKEEQLSIGNEDLQLLIGNEDSEDDEEL